jgi:hypothetical protein
MDKKYDAFISHASEDKEGFVRELAERLAAAGYRVWYDEFTLSVGDGLRRSIDHGIASSRFGIVVLSPYFFSKGWTNYELDGLVQMDMRSPGSILPIWHNLSRSEVAGYSPSLANIVAVQSVSRTMAQVVSELEKRLGEYRYSVGSDLSLVRSARKMAVAARQREAGFQVLISAQADQLINEVRSNSRSEVTFYPYDLDYAEHPFHFWQNEPGDIRLVRHVVYDIETESIVSTGNEIVQNDGCHLISVVKFKRRSNGPIRVLCDVTSTNQFKGLFDDGFEFVEFNHKSQVEHFSYKLTLPHLPAFRQVEVYANDVPLVTTHAPGTISAVHVQQPAPAGSQSRYSLVNKAIAGAR